MHTYRYRDECEHQCMQINNPRTRNDNRNLCTMDAPLLILLVTPDINTIKVNPFLI